MTAAIMLYVGSTQIFEKNLNFNGFSLQVFMGLIAGYFSARLYKTMKGKEWKRTAFLTATFFPGIVFG